jgi:YidC/Oxa1 family membrane protein insertase
VCSPREAGQKVNLPPTTLKQFPDLSSGPAALDCGSGVPIRIPYYALLVLMIGTTFYQQRQMQRASPAGTQQQQQQMMARVMPLFFGVIGFNFPAGLILYWTTTNAVQIVQQHYMFVWRGVRTDAEPVPAKRSGGGFFAKMSRAAMEARGDRSRTERPPPTRRPGDGQRGRPRPPGSTNKSKGARPQPEGLRGSTERKPRPPAKGPNSGTGSKGAQGGGSRDGGDRKKRRKR